MAGLIHTIGHSNHAIGRLVELLLASSIDLLIDVRSWPASRRFPQFDRAALEASLGAAGIAYLWKGDRLGGKPGSKLGGKSGGTPGAAGDRSGDHPPAARRAAEAPSLYDEIAGRAPFAAALQEVIELAVRHRPALMCAEREPLDCHRTVLVGRQLAAAGAELCHILADGRIETHDRLEQRLLARHGLAEADLLHPRSERLAQAWRAQARRLQPG